MDSIMPPRNSKFNIIVVGAGIAGLATATTLSQKGHRVTVLERSPSLSEFGASIGIQANGVRCLKAWGLGDSFEPFVHRDQQWIVWNGVTGTEIGHMAYNEKNYSAIEYGDEDWDIHRKDCQDLLAASATKAGAKVIFAARLTKIDIETCAVLLQDGQMLGADLIIGADGMASFVRSQIPALSHITPVAMVDEQCWRCTIPKTAIRASSNLRWLLSDDHHVWSAPGRYVLGWPLIESRDYDIVLCLTRKGDIPPGRWGTIVEPDDGAKEFSDFCPVVTELLSHVKSAVKWTLGEVPPLETCRSKNGRVVLIGDAFHAMIPHSASGGSAAMEDAACIGECLDWAWEKHVGAMDVATAISLATTAFEDIRKPRVERMQVASHEGYGFLSTSDASLLAIRDEALRQGTEQIDAYLALSEEERLHKPKATADMDARWPLPSYRQWLHTYDAVQASKKHLRHLEKLA